MNTHGFCTALPDNPRNQDGIGETELLVVSFGTSFPATRRLAIGAIEDAMEAAFPELSVRRAFTSQRILDHVQKRDGIFIDNITQALDRAAANGVKKLAIQPTLLIDGLEYRRVLKETARYTQVFEAVSIGKPLLTSDADFKATAKAMAENTARYDDGKTAVCLMGHGTEAASNDVYAKMQRVFAENGYANYFVGTVEAEPTLDDLLAMVRAGTYERVALQPLMIVAGDHAANDMAGGEAGSWKPAFENAGYSVECVLRGMGELEAIRDILLEHAREAVQALR